MNTPDNFPIAHSGADYATENHKRRGHGAGQSILFRTIQVVFLAVLLAFAVSADASAQSWADSVYSKAPSAESSLQDLLDSLGFSIDVVNDELGIEAFCVDSGMNHAIMILEVAGSAASAVSGYYTAGDSTAKTTLFTATSSPGDSTGFSFGSLDSVGFWMKPNIASTPQTWYSEESLNVDDTDHVWVYSTGVPHEYLVCFEDLPDAGDGDYQDLVLRVRFANNPPEFTVSDTTIFVCTVSEVCFSVIAFDDDCQLDSVTLELISGPATFGPVSALGSIDTSICFTPSGTGTYDFVLKATSTGGFETYDTVTVDYTVNTAPVAVCPGDDTLFVCDLSALCFAGFGATDVDGNLVSTVVTGGTLSNDTVCFTPVAGANVITLVATDACGLADTCVTTIHVDLNEAPVASCPGNDTLFVCDLSDICITGFGATDADGNLVSTAVTGGTLSNDTVCFTPVMGNNVITLIATDACGEADTCQTTIYVDVNNPPVATCPGNDTLFVCDLSAICIDGFSTSDPDGNLASATATGGTLTGSEICFTPVAGDNVLTLVATDSCGAADTCTTTIHVVVNTSPVATCPGDDTLFVCDLSDICIDGFSATDADGNLAASSAIGGTLNGTEICFTPVAGNNVLTFIATDSCGAADTCTTNVFVAVNSAPTVSCPSNVSLFVCDLSDICIDGFSCSDVDGNIASSSVTGGTLSNDTVCFTPVAGDNTIIYSCTDSCGVVVSCTTVVTVTVNNAPSASCPATDSLFVCDLSDICIDGFTATDPDGNLESTSAQGGTLTGTEICFTPVMGNNVLTFIAVDSCGLADTCQTTIYVASNSAPTATCPSVPTQFVCNPGDQLCIDGFSCADADGNCDTAWATVGTLTGSTICFVPTAGSNTVGFICLDSCGAADTCEVTFDVVFNSSPVVTCPTIDTQYVCDLSQLCVSGFQATDADNNLASATINGQAYTIGGQYCFTPTAGSNQLVFIATDSCGAADTCSILIPVSVNSAPSVTCPPIDTAFVCDLSTYCASGFQVMDADNNIQGATINGQAYTIGAQYCFTPMAGANQLTLIATDSCGVADTCQTTVYVVVNQAPTASCPAPDTVLVCNLGQVCLDGFSASDPDGNIATRTVSAGTLNGSEVCLNASSGVNNITYIVTDSCGAADTCQSYVYVQVNSAPTVTCPSIDTIKVCDFSASICINGFTTGDPDNNEDFCTINGQPYNPTGAYCFVPSQGLNTLIFECTDLCGASSTCTLEVAVVAEDPTICSGCPDIVIDKVHEVIQGGYQNVSVTIKDLGFDIGAYDLLIQYDASALSFTSASHGQFLLDCQWEYFQYRNGASGNCGTSACPSGVLRVAAIADMNNGPAHPSCLQPAGGDGELVLLRFLVTNDRTLECTYVPIRFIWYDCGDNSVSNPVGDNLYISNEVYDYYIDGNYIAIGDPTAAFPTNFGANSTCDTAIGDGKPDPFRCIDFYNGGIDIACADSLDARGDENLNEIPNEVADIVLFSRYFIYGFSVFTINMQGQIAATDVNADGLALSVADLVYQIRVVVGDADPFPKLAPVSIEYGNRDGKVWVDSPVGAAFMTVAGDVVPTLYADRMDLQYSYDAENNNTRILVFGMDQGDQFSGEFIDIAGGELLSLEMATYDGTPVTAKLVPSSFSLHQNYPNPFNPTTVISFSLPHASEYTLTIFTTTGQAVEEFSGSSEAGDVTLEWDASSAPSGMYFYRLQAGSFSDSKKMILLK